MTEMVRGNWGRKTHLLNELAGQRAARCPDCTERVEKRATDEAVVFGRRKAVRCCGHKFLILRKRLSSEVI